MANTLADLKSRLRSYRKSDDLETFWPNIIAQAEDRLFRDLRMTEQEYTQTGDITSGELALNNDFLHQRSLHFDVYDTVPVFFTPQDFWRDQYSMTQPGTPTRYTVENRTVKLWPLPDQTTEATIVYIGKPARLVNDTDTNDILTENFTVYLYSSLIETEPFVGNDGRALTWAVMYDEAIEGVNKTARDQRYPAGSLAMRPNIRARRSMWPTAKPSGSP